MTSEDAELLADNKDTVRAVLRLAASQLASMAERLGSLPYTDDGKQLVLARAELEGARKLVVLLRSKLESK